jgi:hypothetical protein
MSREQAPPVSQLENDDIILGILHISDLRLKDTGVDDTSEIMQTFSEQLTAAAIQSPTVQNAVAAQAKKSFFSSMGFADDSPNAAANYPPQQFDESVIEGNI